MPVKVHINSGRVILETWVGPQPADMPLVRQLRPVPRRPHEFAWGKPGNHVDSAERVGTRKNWKVNGIWVLLRCEGEMH